MRYNRILIFKQLNAPNDEKNHKMIKHIPSKFLAIGIMTGNSLDAVDLVLTEFSPDGSMRDLAGYTLDYPDTLSDALRKLREDMRAIGYNMKLFSETYEFQTTHDEYIKTVARGVEELIREAEKVGISRSGIDAIGFHGQTCGHNPPSIAKTPDDVYTIQIGNGQMLSDMTGITVIYDFRSDDIFNGGEGAPLAPVHNLHIARDAKARGFFPIAFCNGGNTGNIAVISTVDSQDKVLGWDVGPFNHFIDMLVREETQDTYDRNGKYGKFGTVNIGLLREMFNYCAVAADGSNFLLKPPPKSSDPQWYRAPENFKSTDLRFEDRLRTAEYFSAYAFVYSLKYIPQEMTFPSHFLVFGGGWKNPLVMQDFKDLLSGKGIVLDEHRALFEDIWNRVADTPEIVFSDEKGYSAKYMEARIFADMAYCRVIGEPFSLPETTGTSKPTVGGIIRYPQGDPNNATANFRSFVSYYHSGDLTRDNPESPYYNRACPGFK